MTQSDQRRWKKMGRRRHAFERFVAPAMEKPLLATPEAIARETIDAALTAAGWDVRAVSAINLYTRQGVAAREFPLAGHGEADYLLSVDGQAVGAVEAKKEGDTLTSVEIQTALQEPSPLTTLTPTPLPAPW